MQAHLGAPLQHQPWSARELVPDVAVLADWDGLPEPMASLAAQLELPDATALTTAQLHRSARYQLVSTSRERQTAYQPAESSERMLRKTAQHRARM